MIQVTRFNGSKFYLNAEMIRSIESTPDTVITLMSGEKMIVKEPSQEVVKKIIMYKRIINNPELEVNVGE